MSDDLDLKAAAQAVEKLNKGFDEFKAANDARLKDLEKKGATDPVTEAKLAKIEADMQKAQKVADDAFLAVKRAQRAAEADTATEAKSRAALIWAKSIARERGTDVKEFSLDTMAEYKSAFMSYVRNDERKLSADELKALSVGSDPNGGYVVYPDMTGRMVGREFETSPMRAFASVQTISTDALEGIFDLNEAGSGWVGETSGRPETSTPDLGKWRIPVHEVYAMPAATQKLLDDAAIDMEAWLGGKIAEKFAREENAAFVGGNGVDKPRGFLTYPHGSTLPGQIERLPTGASGAFSAAPAGGDVLISTVYALKSSYRANATWFMNRGTTGAVRRLKDSDGAYLWQPGIQAGQPATILGYPMASFEDMPAIAPDSLSIAFGDMRQAYQIVDRIGIRLLRDPFTAKPYVLFYATKRVGGDVLNFEAIKLIRFASAAS
jgi:HK97 family phage major capsid protein